MQYVNVQRYADEILEHVKETQKRGALWILTMGNDPASASYVRGKIKDCVRCGIPYKHICASSVEQLVKYIDEGNHNPTVGGIIVQLPLPGGIDETRIVNMVAAEKDVDGFRDDSPFEPCTPEGIMYLLRRELGDLTGRQALVIGRGMLVGIPVCARLLAADCTVTIAHSKSGHLDNMLLCSDIIVCAAGKPGLLDLTRCGAEIVVDVGVNRNHNGKLCGDCYNFAEDKAHNMLVTPVPGGIGLLTRAMLMLHMTEGYNPYALL